LPFSKLGRKYCLDKYPMYRYVKERSHARDLIVDGWYDLDRFKCNICMYTIDCLMKKIVPFFWFIALSMCATFFFIIYFYFLVIFRPKTENKTIPFSLRLNLSFPVYLVLSAMPACNFYVVTNICVVYIFCFLYNMKNILVAS